MRPNVNKELLPMKAHYFLFNAGTAPVMPFMPTLARQLGFSTVVVGTMYTILPVVGMLAKPLFGFIADRNQPNQSTMRRFLECILRLVFYSIASSSTLARPPFKAHNRIFLSSIMKIGSYIRSTLSQISSTHLRPLRFQKHRMLFLIGQLVTAISFFCIMFVPPIPTAAPTVELHCHAGVSVLRYCSELDTCIQTNLENHYSNSTLSCKLHCLADPSIWDSVCSDWLNNPPECPKTNPYLDLTVVTNMSDIIAEKQCLFFKVEHDQGQLNGQNVTLKCPKAKKYFNTTCELDCGDEYLKNELSASPVINNSDAMGLYQFWWFFMMLVTSWIGMAVVVSIGDAICFAILGERHHLYGKQRLWGAVGFGLFAILSGVLVDKLSGDSVNKDYTIVFWMTALLIGLDMFASSKLQHTQTSLSQNIFRDVGQLFLSLRVVIFFVWCVLIGLCTALVWNFLFWHLEDLNAKHAGCEGNSMKTLEGFVMGVQCFGGELPFFFLSGWILKKIGHVHSMSLVLLGFGVRFLLYSILENPWYVLPIELLNGVTFGMFYSTMASYASILAPAGSEATLQGLVGAIFEGVGVSIGSSIGGLMFSAVGGSATFLAFGLAAMVAFVVHAAIQWLLPRYSKESATAKYLAPNDAMHMLDEQDYIIVS